MAGSETTGQLEQGDASPAGAIPPPRDGSSSKAGPAKSEGSSASHEQGWLLRGWQWLRPWPQPELERYKAREELTWQSAPPHLHNLAWLLRMQHAEADARASSAAAGAALLSLLGTVIVAGGLGIGVWGWKKLLGWIVKDAQGWITVPENLWQPAVATSALVLLAAGFSTLLFNVARGYHQRHLAHTREMIFTRRVEAAVRLTLASMDIQDPTMKGAFAKLGEQLVTPPTDSVAADAVPELSAMPELLKAAKELVEVALSAKKKTGKDDKEKD